MLFNAKSSPHGKTKRQNRRAAHMERQRAPPKGREAKNGSRGIDSRGRIPERLCRCNDRYAQKKEQRRQREQAKKARRWYFIKQKACGLAMLAITVLAVWATEGDITIAFITVPLGLTCIFSKEMLIMNDYYFTTKERKKNHDTDFRIVRRDR